MIHPGNASSAASQQRFGIRRALFIGTCAVTAAFAAISVAPAIAQTPAMAASGGGGARANTATDKTVKQGAPAKMGRSMGKMSKQKMMPPSRVVLVPAWLDRTRDRGVALNRFPYHRCRDGGDLHANTGLLLRRLHRFLRGERPGLRQTGGEFGQADKLRRLDGLQAQILVGVFAHLLGLAQSDPVVEPAAAFGALDVGLFAQLDDALIHQFDFVLGIVKIDERAERERAAQDGDGPDHGATDR